MKYRFIYNKLKILIDPSYFTDASSIKEQVCVVSMLKNYLNNIEPILCDVQFLYPQFIEESLKIRKVFLNPHGEVVSVSKVEVVTEFFNSRRIPDTNCQAIQNELISLAIKHKAPFILSNFKLDPTEAIELVKKHNISICDGIQIKKMISSFLQGFYIYYKFDSLQGIDSHDMAIVMSDPLSRRLQEFAGGIQRSQVSKKVKERVRSLAYNRYTDILVTIEKITFYKLQRQIHDIENGITENKDSRFYGPIRYYLNYHLLLLWGYIDHISFIISDVFEFGFNVDLPKERNRIGFRNFENHSHDQFLNKIKCIDHDLYNFVISNEFQEWLDILGQLRHRNAHREMLTSAPLLQDTDASKISDEEIDAIIYKDLRPIDSGVANLFPDLLEYQKILDRQQYRISKMEKMLDHVAIIKNGFLDPVARIHIDIENLDRLTSLFLDAAKKSTTLTP